MKMFSVEVESRGSTRCLSVFYFPLDSEAMTYPSSLSNLKHPA